MVYFDQPLVSKGDKPTLVDDSKLLNSLFDCCTVQNRPMIIEMCRSNILCFLHTNKTKNGKLIRA